MAHVHAPGLVLKFDAQKLADEGASFTGDEHTEYAPEQYFVCIDSNAKDALWVPLFASPGTQRRGISAAAKTGHTRWIRYSSFYDDTQLCRVAHKAAQLASAAARDESSPKSPNRMDAASLPQRESFPAESSFRAMKGLVSIR